ncbi:MAG: hypothetical protein NTU61_05855 [Candidatus Altiarchaeota archaeon]|nr:hypothetical protein [Candidatus Altiarchaeota archaeon]
MSATSARERVRAGDDLMNRLVLVAVLLLLSGLCAAWGPGVNKRLCEDSVAAVWGQEVLRDCVPENDSGFLWRFCDVNSVMMGSEDYGKCKKAFSRTYDIHPALIPTDVFMDEALHYDYLHCPIIKGTERWWICGDSSDRSAWVLADKWFSAAETAPDVCTRVYDFCIAVNYYADSESELHQVKNIDNKCMQNIEATADRMVESNESSWNAGDKCNFRGSTDNSLTHTQRLGVGSADINRITEYLRNRGVVIRDKPLQPKSSVIILANSIDKEGAQGLYDLEGVWKEGQKVFVVAGNEKEDTQAAWIENKDSLLSGVNAE